MHPLSLPLPLPRCKYLGSPSIGGLHSTAAGFALTRSSYRRSLTPQRPLVRTEEDGGRAGAGGGIIAKAAHCVKGGFGVGGTGAAAAVAVRTTSLSPSLSLARYLVVE